MLNGLEASNNEICKMLGIKYPIFQGAMAWISDGDLAGNVSKNGGLGVIAGGGMPCDILRQEIKKAKAITNNPIGVNLMLLMADVAEQIDICIEEKVEVITTGAGNPGPYIEKLKAAGIKIFPVLASVALAKRMERLGVDGIIAEGLEAGGHIGSTSTMSLVPQIVEAVSVPVIAAGGIAGGKQMLAAFSLGAKAVQCGTIFLVADECNVHENYKKSIITSKDRSTVSTGNYTGHPVRIIDNKFAKEILEMEKTGISKEDIEKQGVGRLKLAAIDGDVVNGSVMAGQVASMVKEQRPIKNIIEDLMEDYKSEYNNLIGRLA